MAENLCLDSSVIVDQSSDYGGGTYPAENAIDGNTSTWSLTNGGAGEWWKVDLGAIYEIAWIKIVKRSGYGTRPKNYYIQVSDMWDFEDSAAVVRTLITATDEDSELNEYGPDEYEDSSTGIIKARYLRILCHTTNQYINLAEVEIYAEADDANIRLSTISIEALRDGAHNARLSTISMETLRDGIHSTRLSTIAIEVLRDVEAPISAQRTSMFLVFPNIIIS